MPYLTKDSEIASAINQLASAKTLWVDTEVADYKTSHPRLSLIQVLADSQDLTGDRVYVLDVLEKSELIEFFINAIMKNSAIEKVFHNASYDLKFLGKEQAKNITCTLKLAKKISASVLGVPDLKLKTLTEKLCGFTDIDKSEGGSDWGGRPLTAKQLSYAKMDPVYLAQAHLRLLEKANLIVPTIKKDYLPELIPFNVSNVRLAFECPRLFYLGYHFGGMTMFVPPGSSSGIGKLFHDLSKQFIKLIQQDSNFQALLQPASSQIQLEALSTEMKQLFYKHIFFPQVQVITKKKPGKAAALMQLWQGIVNLIERWAQLIIKNRQYCHAKEVLSKTFIAQELNIKHTFSLANGSQQPIQGRLDSLVYDFEKHRLCVLEYKTYQAVEDSAQIAQVALYSYTLRQQVGLPIDSAVYCVLPDLQELTFTWEQLEIIVQELLPQKLQQMQKWLSWAQFDPNPPPATTLPHLCEICPQKAKCQTFFTPHPIQIAKETSETEVETEIQLILPEIPENTTKPYQTDADAFGEKLVTALQHFGVSTEFQGAVIGPAFIRVKLKPNLGVKVGSIFKLSDDLRVQLGLEHPPLIAPQAGYVSIDLPRSDRQVARFEQYVQSEVSHNRQIKIGIGVNIDGTLVEADLSDPNTCHFLVGGTTGSGKSEFLRSLVLSLLVRHSVKALQIVLVDPKRVTFTDFEQLPWLYTPVIKEDTVAIDMMSQLVEEMEQRYRQLEQTGCHDIDSYNQLAISQNTALLPRIVCVFDEYADFMAEKQIRNELEKNIKRLGAKARAAGIHLIIATQRPEAAVVTPVIRSNLPGRVALRTASEADSKIILGGTQTSAAYLLGKGDLLYQSGPNLLRLQGLFTTDINHLITLEEEK